LSIVKSLRVTSSDPRRKDSKSILHYLDGIAAFLNARSFRQKLNKKKRPWLYERLFSHGPMSTSDWDRFRQGDDQAFEALYRANYALLLRYGRSLVHDDQRVKDCIQDLFLNLHRYRTRLRECQSPRLYLIGSLRRLLQGSFRHEPDRAVLDSDAIAWGIEIDTEQLLVAHELSEQLRTELQQALAALPARQREALHLRYFVGLPPDEVAHLMQVSLQTAHNFVHRGLTALRAQMRTASGVLLCSIGLPISFLKKKFRRRG
jgi:RNA polymerase sigma factor (sigma-70 family)